MKPYRATCLSELLRELRRRRNISLRVLADSAGVEPSVASRAERGQDCRVSTWAKLFEGLGYYLLVSVTGTCEEAEELLVEEADARRARRWEGLCAGKRRWR